MAELLNYSERRFRAALAEVPDGVYYGEDAVDDDGESLESMIDAVEENGPVEENGIAENGTSPELEAGPVTNETSGVA